MRELNPLKADLKGRIQVSFVDQFGLDEAGIDGGGLFKEFMTSLCKRAFDPSMEYLNKPRLDCYIPIPNSNLIAGITLNTLRFWVEFSEKLYSRAYLSSHNLHHSFLTKY